MKVNFKMKKQMKHLIKDSSRALALSLCALFLASCAAPATGPTTEGGQSSSSTALATSSAASSVAATKAPQQTSAAPAPTLTDLRGNVPAAGSQLARVVAVMLDNHPDARYQAGLRDADIVFELPVEGSYTRYMALFQSKDCEVVGPVRSSREGFLDRMLEFDPIYVHFGGSAPAIERIAAKGYETVDGMVNDDEFWRNSETGKVAPHNAYTNTKDIRAYAKSRNWHEDARFVNYHFNAQAKAPGGSKAVDVSIDINSFNNSSYRYLSDKGYYERYKDGEKDLDENDQQPLEVMNIIVQNANYYVYEATWQKIELIGEGKGSYISRGEIIPILWKKDGESGLTHYFKQDGSELLLNPGQTWIEIVGLDVVPAVQ